MKKRLLGLCLAACMLTALTGCGEQAAEKATDAMLKIDGEPFTTGEQYKDELTSITVDAVVLADSVMAPLTTEEDSSINIYHATSDEDDDTEGDYVYLDCISTIQNNGSDALAFGDDIYFYCTDGDEVYDDYMSFTESADGTTLDDIDELASGETARVHYALVLPEDISWTKLKVSFIMPGSYDSYTRPLNEVTVNAKAAFTADAPITTTNGAVMTLKSASIADEITAVSEAGGGVTIQPSAAGNKLVDIVFEINNSGSNALTLGTLFGGLVVDDYNIGGLGTAVLEADNDMKYSGSIAAGSTVTAHLMFEMTESDLNDPNSFYLYTDRTFYSIDVNAE